MLDKHDKLRSRVIMAKSAIPYMRFYNKFIERFPELKLSEATIKNTFNCRVVNKEVLEHLEMWADEFNKKFKR